MCFCWRIGEFYKPPKCQLLRGVRSPSKHKARQVFDGLLSPGPREKAGNVPFVWEDAPSCGREPGREAICPASTIFHSYLASYLFPSWFSSWHCMTMMLLLLVKLLHIAIYVGSSRLKRVHSFWLDFLLFLLLFGCVAFMYQLVKKSWLANSLVLQGEFLSVDDGNVEWNCCSGGIDLLHTHFGKWLNKHNRVRFEILYIFTLIRSSCQFPYFIFSRVGSSVCRNIMVHCIMLAVVVSEQQKFTPETDRIAWEGLFLYVRI